MTDTPDTLPQRERVADETPAQRSLAGNAPAATETDTLPSRTKVSTSAKKESRATASEVRIIWQYGPIWQEHVLAGGELRAGNILVGAPRTS